MFARPVSSQPARQIFDVLRGRIFELLEFIVVVADVPTLATVKCHLKVRGVHVSHEGKRSSSVT